MNAFVSVPLRRHDDDLERQAIYWLVKLQSQACLLYTSPSPRD